MAFVDMSGMTMFWVLLKGCGGNVASVGVIV
jgi:hypothetical protein